MRRFALVILPLLSAVTVLIGLYFIYVGARTAMAGRYIGIGLAFVGFGGVGLILGYSLWGVRKQILERLAGEAGRVTEETS
ncbi:MAG TPA: hypothetical protein VNA89_05200 [Gemmatimonadaceae bacterium]|nr:hypothetical protein [Gemmatimonadaceae bacterium]